MFAVKAGTKAKAAPGAPAGSDATRRFVLPRYLRRPARKASRLLSGESEPPRFAATMLTAGFLAATAVYGAWLGGHFPAVVQAVASNTGFAVSEVAVTGNDQTSEIDIVGALGLNGSTSLVQLSPSEARARIVALPWVENASVRKVYPATLEVKLSERKPFALWQQGETLNVIERDGAIIAPYTDTRFAGLPLFVGTGAAERASAFLAGMAKFPEIGNRVKGYVRIADRRWDLHLDNGITVRLPERNDFAAVGLLARIEASDGLLERDIEVVDLRFGDKIVMQLTPRAAEQQAERVKELISQSKHHKGRRI